MGADTVSTHTLKNDATTTIVVRTTTIVSEHEEVVHDNHHASNSVVKGVRKTLRDYWFPSHSSGHIDEDEDEDDSGSDAHHHDQYHGDDPSLFGTNNVMRRAYDYWKSLTKDADEAAKDLVIQAKNARDEAAAEAKWAMFGYKREAREALEAAEKKYKDALAAAERVHEEAHEKARSKWFQAADCTLKEVGQVAKDHHVDPEITHKKWDRFKAAVDSFAFNPPKYACSPSSQYWFGRQNPAADSGWDCREIWDHPSRNDHGHSVFKTLPKKHLPLEKVHAVLAGLLHQAGLKAKQAPSSTSFEPSLKSVKDHYHRLLDRAARNDAAAVDELESMVEKVKSKLNEAKYHEEQTDSWLTSQWNAVVDNAGDAKAQYEHVFKSALKNIKNSRTEAYNSLTNNLQKSVNLARNNIREALRLSKADNDHSRIQKAIHDASQGFTNAVKEAEAKIKAAPKNAYDYAVETFNKDTAQLKAKLEHAAEVAKKSGASISRKASKSVSSAARQVTDNGKNIRDDANRKLHDAKKSVSSKYHSAADNARHGYEQATASVSSMWGAATPFAPLAKVHDSYQQLLGDANHQWFGQHGAHGSHGHTHSIYGALLALYLLSLARKIWLRRNLSRSSAEGALKLTKHRHSHGQGHSSDSDEHEHHGHHEHSEHHLKHRHDKHKHQDHEHEKHRRRHSNGSNSSAVSKHHHHHGHAHHSFNAVLSHFTSMFPVTLLLLVLLDLAGFSRVGLHSLFGGLVASQMLRCGFMNSALEQLGIVECDHSDEVHLGHGHHHHHGGREIGNYLAWTVFGLAAAANAVKVLHDS
ncbi:hypothetical protein BGZ59_000420 [Podila verticillata]|nr:hypothetical protein BGZ59_000420 [Podila verticillata]KAI9241141.1 MAG: hypothetical protein BYD32DRAFT_448894 [Podila humilis]KFH68858.1 hypothetical protein MVEG_05662 [Podila verticillata NRRL 6337]